MCVRVCVGLYVLACSCMSLPRYVYVHTSTCLHMLAHLGICVASSVPKCFWVVYASCTCLCETPRTRPPPLLPLAVPPHSRPPLAAAPRCAKPPKVSHCPEPSHLSENNLAPFSSGRKTGLYSLPCPIHSPKVFWLPAELFTKTLMGNRLKGRWGSCRGGSGPPFQAPR